MTAPTEELDRDHDWQRLDPRMLLVHPIRELLRFLPVLIGIFVAGSASGNGPAWQYLGVLIPIVLGVLRYLTTSFRIAEGRVELRYGLLSRHVLSTPLDRVRTVDLTASPIHRILGMTTLRIGTGTGGGEGSDKLDLDGLPVARAHTLRRGLLRVAEPVLGPDAAEPGAPAVPEPSAPLVRFDLSWLRYAPFTGSGLVVAAAVFGALAQILSTFGAWDSLDRAALSLASGLASVIALVLLVGVVAVLAMVGYLVTNWDFRVTRSDGAWHVGRGLLTTRETSIDEERVAGITLAEPLLLRAAHGRALSAIVTGVDSAQGGRAALVPPAPARLASYVAAVVLGTEAPLVAALRPHGAAAVRRRWTRALGPALLLVGAAVVLVVLGGAWWLVLLAALTVPPAAGVAHDRSVGLGHGLVDGYVLARSGSLSRSRQALAVDHVIGWNLRSTWFQRRAGLTTLVATTAAGGGAVTVLDIPEEDAVLLATTALPALVEQFLAPVST